MKFQIVNEDKVHLNHTLRPGIFITKRSGLIKSRNRLNGRIGLLKVPR